MAKFVLGGIITNIGGSVGGTTFRRVSNGFSMYNKIKGTSLSKLLQNTRVPQIGNIFQQWGLLSDAERSGWNAQALLVTFPDRFGTAKNLTGRQLFSKSNIQLLPLGSSVVDSTGFTKNTIPFVLDSIELDVTGGLVAVTLDSVLERNNVMVSVEVSNKQIFQPTFKSRKVIQVLAPDTGSVAVPITTAILANYPYLAAGMWVAVYVQAINDFGMVSPYQVLIQQAI